MTPKQRAVAAGKSTYFTGRPCKNGHTADRYVSDSSCVVCAVARAQKRYAGKTEEIRSYARDRYWSDPEKHRAKVAERRKADPEAVAEEKRREYERNKARYIERAAGWRAANPDKAREIGRNWCARHPDQSYGYVVQRRMAKLQRTPRWLTPEQRDQIAQAYRQSRRLTKLTGVPHNVDHVVPLRGENVSGLHVPWNLQVLTASQNRAKSNRLAA